MALGILERGQQNALQPVGSPNTAIEVTLPRMIKYMPKALRRLQPSLLWTLQVSRSSGHELHSSRAVEGAQSWEGSSQGWGHGRSSHAAHPAMNRSNSGAMASATENRRGRTKFWTVKKPV